MVTLGQYGDFVVSPAGVKALVDAVVEEAHSSKVHAAYAQLAPIGAVDDSCASGVSLY